jgi:hypothetical protein
VTFSGQLTGESTDLTINLNTYSELTFGGFPIEKVNVDDELGAVTINGTETVVPEGEGEAVYHSSVELPSSFNASDGHSLTLHDVEASSPLSGSATGPITAEDSGVSLEGSAIGPVTGLDGSSLAINGSVASVSLDESSGLSFFLPAGSTPGTDYERLTSTGTINLGGGRLAIGTYQDEAHECPPPPVGQVYQLISTTGSIVGSFSNAPSGSTVISDECFVANYEHPEHPEVLARRWYPYLITYDTASSPETVTATALPAVPTMLPEEPEPPAITGTPIEGQALSETHGSWTNSPTTYSYQWERCNAAGSNCQAIAGASGQSYTLTAADLGSIIRVAEAASNAEGSSAPATSAPTAVVQAAQSQNGGGGITPTNIVLNTGGRDGPVSISSVQIAALLGQQLVPSGKAATIGALLKHAGLVMPFTALEAGTLVVQWYQVPAGAKLAKHAAPKPVLVASGQMTFSEAGTAKVKIRLTAAGRRLLEHAKLVKLMAKGTFTDAMKVPASVTHALVLKR